MNEAQLARAIESQVAEFKGDRKALLAALIDLSVDWEDEYDALVDAQDEELEGEETE